ncbi:MAG: DNA topoisomerase I [Bacteroidales bacterium]|nr:DNA topoisomerase I [Bacteroidales bacterium]
MAQKVKDKEMNLVIVESPAKAKTIEKFLGKDFLVKSSYGHIRDLAKKDFGVDVAKSFEPQYIVSPDKKEIVKELKSLVKKSDMIWLASDEDREGEAIAWHLSEVLELTPDNTKRIVFHEITKDAILKAIQSPRQIDLNLVNAQQARRVLDRLVGFELSPVLWKKVKPSLSAGRVQSVAVRILVEREREIFGFEAESAFRVTARFLIESKLGFSVGQTMSVAQRLYEAGKITYMRTDSVNLADTAVALAVEQIKSEMGAEYVKVRKYKTKSKGAQEAHEAIRPTYMDQPSVAGSSAEQKLYDLIYKRTIASQMSDAQIEKTNVNIKVSGSSNYFQASGEVIQFDGFLKVYIESTDQEKEEEDVPGFLPLMNKGDQLDLDQMEARERWTQKPPRYTEASLVRKLEELGIGRPSTYAPTISTIQQRGYVVKEDRDGTPRNYRALVLKSGKVSGSTKTENTGAERSKLFPTDIGMVVNDFLVRYFPNIVNHDFTAEVEKEFDSIAAGDLVWNEAIEKFYTPFHGRYGPMAQLGDGADENEKPAFASLTREQHIETITLEEALKLFELPRELGLYEEKKVVVGIGRFGPYVRHDGKFVSLKKDLDDPLEIVLDRAIELIEEKREKDNKKIIKAFEEEPGLQILNGRWGPYINFDGGNYKIPKTTEAASLSLDDCRKLIKETGKKSTTKKSSVKKPAAGTRKKTTAAKTEKTKTKAKTTVKAKKK